jgi:hypothetical protein
MQMRNSMIISATFAALVISSASMAQEQSPAKPPPPLLREIVQGMRSSTEPMRVVIFYVSDPDTPFLDPAHH